MPDSMQRSQLMSNDLDLITEREFDEVWGAYAKPSGDLFQIEDIRDQPPDYIWTIVDSGDDSDGNWYAQPGFHVVNRLGYVMTRKPWTDSTPDAIYFLDDFDHDESEA
jgi:hypothetical protein